MSVTEVGAASPGQELLGAAVHRHRAMSWAGLQERLFTWAFSGLVYPQIWEDPRVDLDALDLRDGEHVVAIASGGCNVLSYLTAAAVRVTAVDLNPAHIALNRLKLAATRNLPDYQSFHRFLAQADTSENVRVYRAHLAHHLDADTRRY